MYMIIIVSFFQGAKMIYAFIPLWTLTMKE